MADQDESTTPEVHVTVGYPVHEMEWPWRVPGQMGNLQPVELRVEHMKTFIVLLFILACIQISLYVICAVYIREILSDLAVSTSLLNNYTKFHA
jgi:hypothetical protein